jgi:nucleoid-associated protein YgaU
MKSIGIKLADGSFYPILEEESPAKKMLDLTTAHDNQTTVMVDLYRSETGTMEDAEYVDTLQIDNLIAHPNGEPDLSFNISLDENNKLSAEINDPESGEHSGTTITLVSRTLEERMSQSDFSLSQPGSFEEPVQETPSAADGAELAAGGLLAAAAKKREEENEEEDGIQPPESPDFSDLDLPENLDLTKASEDAEAPAAENFTQDFQEPAVHDTVETYEDTLSFAKNVLGDEPEKEPAAQDDFSLDLPDFADSEVKPEEKKPAVDETVPAEDTISAENFDTPVSNPQNSDETAESTDEPGEEINFDIPDFSTTNSEDTDSPAPEKDGSESLTDDFALPDFGETDSQKSESADTSPLDDFFNDTKTADTAGSYVNDNTPSNGIKFDGLYDKETEEKKSIGKDSTETEIRKKTNTPVLICIICALICVIAALLILFVIPSKYNLITMHTAQEVQAVNQTPQETAVKPEEPAPVPEQTPAPAPAPEAKEDEVVVAPAAETVVPEKPAEPAKKAEDITYHIKWGDTLWDIADAYYKNPWRYHRIAKYNHIKDPDYIISGTTIKLPAE